MFIRYDEDHLWKLYDGFHKSYAGAPAHYLSYLETLNKTYMKADVKLNQLFGDFTPLTTELARQLPEVYLPLPRELFADIQTFISKNSHLEAEDLITHMDSLGLYIELQTVCTEHPEGGTVRYVRIPDVEFGIDFALYQNKLFILNPAKFSPPTIFCAFILVDYRVLERVWGKMLLLPECPWHDKLTYRNILGDLLYSYFEGPIGGSVDKLVRKISNLRTMGILTKRSGWHTSYGFLWKDKTLLDFDFILAVNAFDITKANYDRLKAATLYAETIKESCSNCYPIGLAEVEDENYGLDIPKLMPHLWFEDWDMWAKWLDEDIFKTDMGHNMDVQEYLDPVLKDKGNRCDTVELTVSSQAGSSDAVTTERTEHQTDPFLFDESTLFDEEETFFDYNHTEGLYKEEELSSTEEGNPTSETTVLNFNQIFKETTESFTDDTLSMDGEAVMLYKDTQNLRRYGTKDSAIIDMFYGRARYLMDTEWSLDSGIYADLSDYVMNPLNSYTDISVTENSEGVTDILSIEKIDGDDVSLDTVSFGPDGVSDGVNFFTSTLQSPPHDFFDLPLVDRVHAYTESLEIVNFPN